MTPEILQVFLKNNCFIFHSEYGKKGVELTTAQRLKNQITNVTQLKNGQNYNIFTGAPGNRTPLRTYQLHHITQHF